MYVYIHIYIYICAYLHAFYLPSWVYTPARPLQVWGSGLLEFRLEEAELVVEVVLPALGPLALSPEIYK